VQAWATADPAKIAGDVNAKAWLTHRVLEARRAHPELFADGSYEPLVVRGPRADHVVAFERRLGDNRAIIIAPRLVGSITDWKGTSVVVGNPSLRLQCAFTGRTPVIRDGYIEWEELPFTLLLQKG
jgi:maltooligosyltrehalose synthase